MVYPIRFRKPQIVITDAVDDINVYITDENGNKIINEPVWADSGEKVVTTYSPLYNQSASRKSRAVEGYQLQLTYYDCTGNIGFYFCDSDGMQINTDNTPLFTHNESLAYLLPFFQEG